MDCHRAYPAFILEAGSKQGRTLGTRLSWTSRLGRPGLGVWVLWVRRICSRSHCRRSTLYMPCGARPFCSIRHLRPRHHYRSPPSHLRHRIIGHRLAHVIPYKQIAIREVWRRPVPTYTLQHRGSPGECPRADPVLTLHIPGGRCPSPTSASHSINLRTTHNFISASTQNPLSNHWTSWTNAVVRS